MLSTKNLARYDCWEDKPPEEWLQICLEDPDRIFDGVSSLFENGKYVPKQVKVKGYDANKQRYLVMFTHSEQEKYVSRLSLIFFNEDKNVFDYRKSLCEKRRTDVDEFTLYTRYIDEIPNTIVNPINPEWIKKIQNYLKFQHPNLANKYNNLFRKTETAMSKQLMIVHQDFLRQMKKCRILIEMQEEENKSKFIARSLKIRPYYQQVKTPVNCIVLKDRQVNEFRKIINWLDKKSLLEDKVLTEVLVAYLKECENLKKVKILVSEIDETKLPIRNSEFIAFRDKYNDKSESKVIAKCNSTLRYIIMDRLTGIEIELRKEKKKVKKYELHMVNAKLFENSTVKKVLQYFNLILRNKIKELCENSIDSFINFISKYSQCNYTKEHYLQKNMPLFVTSLKSSGEDKDGKKKKDKPDEKSKNVIYFEPSLNDFEHSLEQTLDHIKVVINKIQDMVSLIMNSIDLKVGKIFDLTDEFPRLNFAKKRLKEIITEAKMNARKVRDSYGLFEEILSIQVEAWLVKNFFDKKEIKTAKFPDIELCRQKLSLYYNQSKILDSMHKEVNQIMFRIQTDELRTTISEKLKQLSFGIVDRIKLFCEFRIQTLNREAEEKIKNLDVVPTNEEEYNDLRILLDGTEGFIAIIKNDLQEVARFIELMEEFYFNCEQGNKSINQQLRTAYSFPSKVHDKAKAGLDILNAKKGELGNELSKLKEKLRIEAKDLDIKFENIKKVETFANYETFYKSIQSFNNQLNEAIEAKTHIRRMVVILTPEKESSEDEYPENMKIEAIKNDNINYRKIWEEANDIFETYKEYIKKSIGEQQCTQNNTGETFMYVSRLAEARELNESIAKMASYENTMKSLTAEFREKIKYYDSYSWMVMTFKSNVLKEEDWKEIKHELNKDLPEGSPTIEIGLNTLLCDLVKMNIVEKRAELEAIKSKANRRAGYYSELKTLTTEYNKIVVTVFLTKQGKTTIKGIDDIQIQLDDQTNKLQSILSNPVTQSDAKLKLDAKNYIDKLKSVQLILEEVVKFQLAYLYLEPIFSGGEVNKALINEKKDFDKVNQFWKTFLENLDSVTNNLGEFIEKDISLYKLLIENNKLLASITKSLNDYLNIKRKAFPRFYFVSDEDLMKILAQTKDPTLVQPHLSKCFEGINTVIFDETNSIIGSMKSAEEEVVQLIKPINVNEEICKGYVEIWLTQLEECMQKTMEKNCEESLKDFTKKPRIEWIQAGWPGQIVQVVDQIVWTNDVENSYDSIAKGNTKALDRQLQNMIGDVRFY